MFQMFNMFTYGFGDFPMRMIDIRILGQVGDSLVIGGSDLDGFTAKIWRKPEETVLFTTNHMEATLS